VTGLRRAEGEGGEEEEEEEEAALEARGAGGEGAVRGAAGASPGASEGAFAAQLTLGCDPSGLGPGCGGSEAPGHCASGALALRPLPLPPPGGSDLVRPADVGDGSGYVGAGRLSFLGAERGWADGVGVGAPAGPPLAATYRPPEASLEPPQAGDAALEAQALAQALAQAPGAPGEAPRVGAPPALAVSAPPAGAFGPSGGGGAEGAGGGGVGGGGGPLGAAAGAGAGGGGGASAGGASAAGAGSGGAPGAGGGGAGGVSWDGGNGTWGSRPRGLLLIGATEHAAAVTAIAVCQVRGGVRRGARWGRAGGRAGGRAEGATRRRLRLC